MKAIVCSACDGTGEWKCNDEGNMYKHPIKCEECNGSGVRILKRR